MTFLHFGANKKSPCPQWTGAYPNHLLARWLEKRHCHRVRSKAPQKPHNKTRQTAPEGAFGALLWETLESCGFGPFPSFMTPHKQRICRVCRPRCRLPSQNKCHKPRMAGHRDRTFPRGYGKHRIPVRRAVKWGACDFRLAEPQLLRYRHQPS